MSPAPEIQTARLHLRPFTEADAALFHKINTDPFVRRFLWDDESISEALAAELMAQNATHWAEDGFGLWKIQLPGTGETIGYSGLWYFFEEAQPQLLYALLPDFAGQGYASEAARAVIEDTFSRLGFTYLIAATDPPNLPSQKVAERIGMQLVDVREADGKTTHFYRIDRP